MKNSIVKILSIIFSMSLVISACGTRDYSDAETEKKKAEIKSQEEKKKALDDARKKANVTWGDVVKNYEDVFTPAHPKTAAVLNKGTKFLVYGGATYGLWRLGKWGWVSWKERKSKKKSAGHGHDDDPSPSGTNPSGPQTPTPSSGGGAGGGAVNPTTGATTIAPVFNVGSKGGGHADEGTNWPKVVKVGGTVLAVTCGLAIANFVFDAVDTSIKGAVNEYLIQPPAVTAPAVPGAQ